MELWVLNMAFSFIPHPLHLVLLSASAIPPWWPVTSCSSGITTDHHPGHRLSLNTAGQQLECQPHHSTFVTMMTAMHLGIMYIGMSILVLGSLGLVIILRQEVSQLVPR
jgi:hypothetical protein